MGDERQQRLAGVGAEEPIAGCGGGRARLLEPGHLREREVLTEAPRREPFRGAGEQRQGAAAPCQFGALGGQAVVTFGGLITERSGVVGFVALGLISGPATAPAARLRVIQGEARPHRHTGFGLGLAIAKRLIEEHGGHVAVTSEVGKGSVFRVELPA